MAVKIRLQRHGRKSKPFYHIVVADARAPRDGRFIERLGSYNPNTNPATIDLDVEKALQWLFNGAEPTDTANAILRYKGVLAKKHLQVGVRKGSITQETADARFADLQATQASKVENKKDSLVKTTQTTKANRLKEESLINAKRAESIIKKNTPPVVEVPAVEAPEPTIVEEAVVLEQTLTAEVASVAATPAEETPSAAEAPAQTDSQEPAAS